jgi:hypothetical protein
MTALPSLESLTWLAGCWKAKVLDSPSDCTGQRNEFSSEICFLSPSEGTLAGVWRVGGSLSFISIQETAGRIEWREREHSLTLEPRANAPLLILHALSASPEEVVFQSEGETGHQRIRQFRMHLRAADATTLVVQCLAPDGTGGWLVAREEEHHRTPIA